MRLRYTLTALRQIERALGYVGQRSPQGAAGIRDTLAASLAMVQQHPKAGHATSRKDARRVVLVPYPYILFYRIVADEIVVTRFRHAARRPVRGEELS